MKTLMQSLAFATAFIVCGHAQADKLTAAHTASPDFYQVLTENEEVLVLKMVLKPGDADAMHHHNNETVYFERGGTLAITLENGEIMVVTVPDGQVMWHEAWSHQVTNVGNTEVVAVIVEAKEKR